MIRTEGPVWTPATEEKKQLAESRFRSGGTRWEIDLPVTIRVLVKHDPDKNCWVAACLPLQLYVARKVQEDAVYVLGEAVRKRLE